MSLEYRVGQESRVAAFFSGKKRVWMALLFGLGFLIPSTAFPWTIYDYNPLKLLRDARIFSLTRANPIGTRILVIPVLDEPVNAPVYTRVCTEFTNQLRSFASEVWLITDLPEGPVKQGFYAGLTQILAEYRLKNRLPMELLSAMIPDFECDYIALFEVTSYDRYWIDHDVQQRVGLRCVLYDYEDGEPRIEKYYQGGRGRRLEEGAFSEAERFAVKGLVEELERPLRSAMKEKEKELQRRYAEINELAALTNQKEWAIHKYDLGVMAGQIAANKEKAALAERSKAEVERERDYWKQQAESNKKLAEQYQTQLSQPTGNVRSVRKTFRARTYRNPFTVPRFGLPCPPGTIKQRRVSRPPSTQPEILAPDSGSPLPPRMPTLKPIQEQSRAQKPSESSSVIAFRGFNELPEYELETGSVMNPPWEKEPEGEWEFVGPDPEF